MVDRATVRDTGQVDQVDRLLLPPRQCVWCHQENREASHWPRFHDRCALSAGAFLPIERRRALSAPQPDGPEPLGDWRHQLLDRWGSYCWFCRRDLTPRAVTREHLLPLCRGGDNRPGNIRPACAPCNTAKASMTEDEFLDHCRAVVEDRWRLVPGVPFNRHERRRRLSAQHREVCARVYAARVLAA